MSFAETESHWNGTDSMRTYQRKLLAAEPHSLGWGWASIICALVNLVCVVVACLTGGLLWVGLPMLAMLWNGYNAQQRVRLWATAGTVKLGTHDAYNALCGCGVCEASGRWLKRPLPAEPPRDERAWFEDITDECTPAERQMLSGYLADGKAVTAEFLHAWAAAQRPPERQEGSSEHDNVTCIRAAIEHIYRNSTHAMPDARTRIAMAHHYFERGDLAVWFTPEDGDPHYIFDQGRPTLDQLGSLASLCNPAHCDHTYILGQLTCIKCYTERTT